ncbi:Reverse transcriptase-like [Sesbania bispinosa]|nr:Reverse transcriptase-like [Sesbania bispinosa]
MYSFKVESSRPTSCVFRDREGFLEFCSVKKVAAASPLLAEALAVREAMLIAGNLGMPRVIFELDSLGCGFTWVSREGNLVAHLLASLAKLDLLPPNWQGVLPLDVQNQLKSDRDRVLLHGHLPGEGSTKLHGDGFRPP